MTKKRKVPGSGSSATVPADPHAMQNEGLALLLASRSSSVAAQTRNFQARHPTLTPAQAADLVERCGRARDAAFVLVAATVAQGGDSPQAAGRILAAYPWMGLANVEALCSEGFVLAVR
jgi:hypothetical protein